MRRDGGSVLPAHANTGDPNGPFEAGPLIRPHRANIHDGSEHNTLQSEAGYIDARPHVRQIDETLLQRTAGPYIGVIFVGSTRFRRSRHVRFAPIAFEPSHRSESTRCATSEPSAMQHQSAISGGHADATQGR